MSARYESRRPSLDTGRLKLVTASWISVALMLSCVIYLAAMPGIGAQDGVSNRHQGAPNSAHTVASVYYLA